MERSVFLSQAYKPELLAAVEQAAREANRWIVLYAIQVHEGGDGYVPHGFVMVERPQSPLAGREYSTHGWNDHRDEGGLIAFDQGNYDLEHAEAFRDLLERSKVTRVGGPA